MFGLVLAAIYVAFHVLFSNSELLSAFEKTLPFLWYWHMIFTVFKAIVWILLPICGVFLSVAGDHKEKVAGVGMLVASPILLIVFSVSSILFLLGVYGIDSGIEDGSIKNQSHVIIGFVLYFLGILVSKSSKATNSKR